jgi:hypothetical protein
MALDYSKLDDEQLANAAKVAAAAQKYGINPDFVMPMVMAESGFRHIKNPNSSAFGIMQLMPATAKGLKVDPNDVDENIEGGMRLLKELSGNQKIGSDPYKVLAGYNAGPSTAFLASGDLKDLPDETLSHMAKVANFYGGELPTLAFEKTEELPPGESAPEAPLIASGNVVKGTQPGEKTLSPEALSLVGGGAGLTVGAAGVTAQKSAGLIKDLYGRAFPGAPDISRAVEPAFTPEVTAPAGGEPSVRTASSPLEGPSAQTTRILQGGEGETLGTTGRARQEGYNIETAQRAAAKKEADMVAELARRAGITEHTASQFLARQPGLTSSPAGIISPRVSARPTIGPRSYGPAPLAVQAAQSGVPTIGAGEVPTIGGGRAPARVAPSPIPVTPAAAAAPEESILAKLGRYANKAAPVVTPVAKIGFSGLSGALGANQLYEAEKNREKNGLTFGNSLDYLSGVGGLVGMIPTMPTQAAAAVLQTPATIKAAKDWAQQNPKKVQQLIDLGVFDQIPGQP